MNIQSLGVTQDQARQALREYKTHRSVYDERDWEIERIYRQIAGGKKVISVGQAISATGVDDWGRPKLAIARADCKRVRLDSQWIRGQRQFRFRDRGSQRWNIECPFDWDKSLSATAQVPRIPPQHRPASTALRSYWILFEAEWRDIPRDPMLLRRIGKDAWIVLAAWDLTDVEVSVLRANPVQ